MFCARVWSSARCARTGCTSNTQIHHLREKGPAHAWALWQKSLPNAVSFAESSEEIRRYLAGDVLPCEMKGWTLLQVDGLSLGWAKGDGRVLKNHYPKALRRAT